MPHPCRCKLWSVLLAVYCGMCALPGRAEENALSLPAMVVGKTAVPPRIDGQLSPGEWDRAAACSGFITAYEAGLSLTQSVAWITYDDEFFYVAFKNNRGPTDKLLSKQARRPDDIAIVHDHSNEIWFSPPGLPATTYQTLLNAYPGVFDVKMIPSVGSQAMSWSAGWQLASSETAEHWIIEGKAPIRSFGNAQIHDGDKWRALFTTDVLGDGGGFRAWAPGGGFAEISRHGHLEFRESSAVVQLLDVESLHFKKFSLPIGLTGPTEGQTRLQVKLRIGGKPEPAKTDRILTKDVTLAAGEHQQIELAGNFEGLALPTYESVVQESPRVVQQIPYAICELTVTNQFGAKLYQQTLPAALDGYVRRPPEKLTPSPYKTPLGLTAMYAPLHKQLIVQVDRLYLPERARAVKGHAKLVNPQSGETVAERPLAPFYFDFSEFPIDLGELKVPIETEADWRAAQPVVQANELIEKENERRREKGQPALPLRELPLPPAKYELQITVHDEAGKELASTTQAVQLKGYQLEWLPNKIGISDDVIRPWTPLKISGQQIELWNKRYTLNGLGLAERIENAGQPQLAGRMKLLATIDGKEREVTPPALTVAEQHPAWANLTGKVDLGGITLTASSRVEFDGTVQNTWQLAPQSGQSPRLDRLTLLVTMPKVEAPCFVTTAGGWSATHGWTPEHWTSQETAAATLRYNFVPYVLLTDSDRGFSWFADSVRGWILDEQQPTVELDTKGETVELRVNFITRSSVLAAPTELQYGWNVTPQKPQPRSWRATHIDFKQPYPQANVVFYGGDQIDLDVLWAYYSSPYPKSYEKSKEGFDYFRSQNVNICAGNIAHSIARYKDYQGRTFYELAADWGESPGKMDSANVARSRGPNDFQLWHWNRWITESGLAGLYFDENYLTVDYNYLSGGAFLLPDEQVHPGYNYLGLRDLNKRIRYLFQQRGLDGYRLWLHTTSGQPTYAWLPDVAMEAENVEPAGGKNDYLAALPAARLRSIGMGRNLGTAPIIMCQSDRHWKEETSPWLVHQFVGWVLAHDCLPESNRIWPALAAELQMWDESIVFRPYWKTGQGIRSVTPETLCSAHVRPGQVVLWVVNQQWDKDEVITLLDLKKLGLNPDDPNRPIHAFDAERGNQLVLEESDQPGMTQLALGVLPRGWRAVRLIQPEKLKGAETFRAGFDRGLAAADESFGYGFAAPLEGSKEIRPAAEQGKTGRALDLGTSPGFAFSTRQHVSAEQGTIRCELFGNLAEVEGTLLQVGNFLVDLNKGKFELLQLGEQPKVLARAEELLPAGEKWHAVRISWQGTNFSVLLDEQDALQFTLPEPLPIARLTSGPIGGKETRSLWQSTLTFGPLSGVKLDNLVLERE